MSPPNARAPEPRDGGRGAKDGHTQDTDHARPRQQRVVVLRPRRRCEVADRPSNIDWDALASTLHVEAVARRDHGLRPLARSLGVDLTALLVLEVGLDARGVSYWPMRDRDGQVCGLRTRLLNGAKLAVRGSRSGYFGPEPLLGRGPLLIVEGGSDVAAGLTLGLDTIGRAAAKASTRADAGALRLCSGRDVVVIPDRDPAGIAGGRAFATAALLRARSLRWLLPPRGAKDLRAALVAGLTRKELLELVEATPPVRPRVEVAR